MAKPSARGSNLGQELKQLTKAAIGDSLRKPEDAWVVITATQNAELDGYGPGYVYVRLKTPANPEVSVARILPNRRKLLVNGLCVEIRHIKRDDKGAEWLVANLGDGSWEQFHGTTPVEVVSPHTHSATDVTSGTLDAARLPTTAVTPGSYTAANITVDSTGRLTAASNGSGGGSGFPQGYIAGCEVDVASTGTDVTVQAGVCRSDDDAYTMIDTASDTVDMSTTGAGALDAGTIANSTWYYIYRIAKSSDATTSVLASTSSSAPTMPSGYDKKRLIGHVLTDGSAQLYRQRTRPGGGNARDVMWQELTNASPFRIHNNLNVAATTWTDVDCSAVIPAGAREGRITIYHNNSSGNSGISWRESGTSMEWGAAALVHTGFGTSNMYLPVSSARVGQVYTSNVVTENLTVLVHGYVANLLPVITGTSGA
jgi:hypothetical protein